MSIIVKYVSQKFNALYSEKLILVASFAGFNSLIDHQPDNELINKYEVEKIGFTMLKYVDWNLIITILWEIKLTANS